MTSLPKFQASPDFLMAVPATIFTAGFSGERIVEVVLADGTLYKALVPAPFCFEPEGLVAVKVLYPIGEEEHGVELPNSHVVSVDNTALTDRPRPVRPGSRVPS